MLDFHDVTRVRAAEAPLLAALPAGTLMRRAAFGLAVHCARLLRGDAGDGNVRGRRALAGTRVALLVGAGDNGGDALHAGAYLRRRGVAVDAHLLAPAHAHADGLAALRAAGGRVHEAGPENSAAPGPVDLVLDGIVGIGGSGPLRPAAARLHEALLTAGNRRPLVVAVDLPSGIDPNTGRHTGPHVTADLTVAFGTRKPCHALAPAACGTVVCVDIGLDLDAPVLRAVEAADVGAAWPVPAAADDKYTQGVVGIAAGSAIYPGAAVLATGGALAATSGMVRYAGFCAGPVLAAHPEVVARPGGADAITGSGRVQAWVVGPGLGTGDEADAILTAVLAQPVPVLVDADALTLLARRGADALAARLAPTVLTPHSGEFGRLGDLGDDRLAAVRALAVRHRATVLLKGRATLVASPDGAAPVLVSDAGSSWAATAGSGDILSGVIGALLAAGLPAPLAAAHAAYVHGVAAAHAAREPGPVSAPIGASDLLGGLRGAIARMRGAAGNAGARSS